MALSWRDPGTAELSLQAPRVTIINITNTRIEPVDHSYQSEARPKTSVDRLRSEYSAYNDPSQLMASAQFLRGLDSARQEVETEIEAEKMVVGGGIALTTSISGGYVVWLARSGVLLSSILTSLPAWQFMDPLPVLNKTASGLGIDEEEADSLESIIGSGAEFHE